ncbi:MAG: NAD kinase [Devosiaceae bacterium]|nr:NAD kinase [Devosiaceae bacterium MH13]
MKKPFERIGFIASSVDEAQDAKRRLQTVYGDHAIDEADVIVALGGDGLMLSAMHRFMNTGVPIYGMNRGSVGFLMNEYAEAGLLERLEGAVPTTIHPLTMTALTADGETTTARALNEVSLLRQTYQAAKLRISVDDHTRLEELVCDGALVSTPAGSTAYNLSAHGPILPLNATMLALTPISPFRPRRWRGAILPATATVRFDVLEADKRPVAVAADAHETRDVVRVDIAENRREQAIMLFDPGRSLEERILNEQFSPI